MRLTNRMIPHAHTFRLSWGGVDRMVSWDFSIANSGEETRDFTFCEGAISLVLSQISANLLT